MVKYREILRLAAMGVSQNGIAFSCGCAQSTVSDVLRAARAHKVAWPLPEEMDDAAIRSAIYPRESRKARDRAQIDHEHIAAHVHMFSFFGGSTPILVPDNCKTAITKNAKEALIVNEQYRRMSEHYGCAVVPARVRKPRDKASVEMGVGIIERQAMMALRKRRFMSLAYFKSGSNPPPITDKRLFGRE